MKYSEEIKTEIRIKFIKDAFEKELAKQLNLIRVSAPLFVKSGLGINDDLNGSSQSIKFNTPTGMCEIVQSLAKWKRIRLKELEIKRGAGIYTDMNAIRPCEVLDNLHSYYVDQWDWEKTISTEDRNIEYLKDVVNKIYTAIKNTEIKLVKKFNINNVLVSNNVVFIEANDLLKKYPKLNPSEREYQIVKENGTVFIIGIGKKLDDGTIHDSRAADYDDWELNGDLLIWDEELQRPIEISSMGIRVNAKSLDKQLKESGEKNKKDLYYHNLVLEDKLPLTIGGGIGQSRLCMLLLHKKHIKEVQYSVWN